MSHLIQALHMPLTLPVMQWPRTGRKPAATGEGRTEKGTRKGARRLALCGPGAARPLSLPFRSGDSAPSAPGVYSPDRRNNRYKLRHREEFPGRRAASRGPDLRPAPRRRTCDRCEAPHSRPAALAL